MYQAAKSNLYTHAISHTVAFSIISPEALLTGNNFVYGVLGAGAFYNYQNKERFQRVLDSKWVILDEPPKIKEPEKEDALEGNAIPQPI